MFWRFQQVVTGLRRPRAELALAMHAAPMFSRAAPLRRPAAPPAGPCAAPCVRAARPSRAPPWRCGCAAKRCAPPSAQAPQAGASTSSALNAPLGEQHLSARAALGGVEELAEPRELRVVGALPEWLAGTYLRNGPGMYEDAAGNILTHMVRHAGMHRGEHVGRQPPGGECSRWRVGLSQCLPAESPQPAAALPSLRRRRERPRRRRRRREGGSKIVPGRGASLPCVRRVRALCASLSLAHLPDERRPPGPDGLALARACASRAV